MTYIVDGRFLTGRSTGLHRVARSFVIAAKAAGLDAEVWAPTGTTDPLADRLIASPGGRIGGRLWEQAILPAHARGRMIWSLTNTAPLAKPGAVVVHDLASLVNPAWFSRSMQAYGTATLRGATRARLVITVSAAIKDELVDRGVRGDKIHVVSPAVDERFRPATDDAVAASKQRHGLDRSYALVVGWPDPRKDAGTAFAAHAAVEPEIPHDLVLLGEPHPTFAPVQLPALPSIKRLGHVSDDDLVALLTGADVLLYPSLYEGFGLPPLEAMACGTPAVASDIPAIRESTQGTARLAPPGDIEQWTQALRDGLTGGLSCPSRPPSRSQQEVGQQLVAALSSGSAA